jgi:hypothetical protein
MKVDLGDDLSSFSLAMKTYATNNEREVGDMRIYYYLISMISINDNSANQQNLCGRVFSLMKD